MIQFVEPIIPKGEDKKAVVMLVAGQLYDYIVISIFPLWLRPMSSTIKKILISIVVGELIDFIVSKYHNGLWNMEKNEKKRSSTSVNFFHFQEEKYYQYKNPSSNLDGELPLLIFLKFGKKLKAKEW